jgi:hypothetical protein
MDLAKKKKETPLEIGSNPAIRHFVQGVSVNIKGGCSMTYLCSSRMYGLSSSLDDTEPLGASDGAASRAASAVGFVSTGGALGPFPVASDLARFFFALLLSAAGWASVAGEDMVQSFVVLVEPTTEHNGETRKGDSNEKHSLMGNPEVKWMRIERKMEEAVHELTVS